MDGQRSDEASSLRDRVVCSLHAAPEAFVFVTAAAAAVGVVSAWVGLRPLSTAGASRVVLAALVVVGVLVLGRGARANGRRHTSALAALPALVLVGAAILARLLPPGARAEWFLGGDHVRHLIFVADERVAGNLDYVDESYPRAWHTVITTIWSASGADIDGPGLRSLVDLLSTATWLLPALLSLATGSLTVAVAQRYGASRAQSGVAGLAGAAALLLNPFLANYQALGFENSYVGAIVLAVVAKEVVAKEVVAKQVVAKQVVPAEAGTQEVVDPERLSWAALVALVGVVVCAHSWQLLLPAAGVAFLHLAWPVIRRGPARARVALVAASSLGVVVALPALLAVFTVIGIEHATDSGVEAPVPVPLLLLGVAAAVAMVPRRRGDSSLATLTAIVLLPSVTAVAVAVRVGIPLSDYYPSKLFWHSAVLGLSPLAVLLVRGWSVLGRSRTPVARRAARNATTVVAVLALVFALVSPAGAFVGAWSVTRGPVVLDAITSPGARDAQVVWLGTVGDDTIARILLDFYRVPDEARTPSPPLDVAEECELLRAAQRPAVLSNRSDQDVRARYACVRDVTAVQAKK